MIGFAVVVRNDVTIDGLGGEGVDEMKKLGGGVPGRGFLALFLLGRKIVSENGVVTLLLLGVVSRNGLAVGLGVVVGSIKVEVFCKDWIDGPMSLKFVP